MCKKGMCRPKSNNLGMDLLWSGPKK
jgi:hypothetical protein